MDLQFDGRSSPHRTTMFNYQMRIPCGRPFALLMFLSFFIGQNGPSVLYAQSKHEVPRLITYQAQLLDKDGNLVKDGEYAVTTKLYTDADGDEFLWGDTYIISTHNGIVDLALGSGENELPASVHLSRSLWLGISLNGAEEMRPLLSFSAVPYALNVANNSITASKMATDYIASFSINGQQITGRGGKIDLYAGNGIKLAYDSVSNQLLIMGSERGGSKGEPEVLTVSVYAKKDLVVDANATFNVDSGQTDIRGNTIIGSSSSKTINFKAKAISDLDMNLYSLSNADSLKLGKQGTKRGVIDMVSELTGQKVTIMADSMAANRKYTIPDVGEDSRFLMTSGLQRIDTVIFTNILIPSNDNAYALGDPDLRYRDIYMGPGSLHLIASVDEGVVEEVDYAQQIDVSNTDGNGDLVFRESGTDLLRVSPIGDVTVTGATLTAGLKTSENITLSEDNFVQIGAPEARVADIYLGPASLHLIAGVDDGVTTSVDYAQQIDTEGADNGDLVFRESGDDLMRITSTGDVTVIGATKTAGLETSENITLTEDNAVQIGSVEARVADIYLGPASLHLIAGVDDGVTTSVDYAQQIDTEGDDNGDLVIRESGDDLLRITATGNVTVMGATKTAGLETSENITLTEDNAVQIGSVDARVADIYLGPASLHLIAGVDDGVINSVDYAQQIDTEGADNGDLVIRESGDDLLRITATGDVTVTGATKTAGLQTSENITLTEDNAVQIGSAEARVADIYLGPASLHLIAGVDDGVVNSVDYAQQIDTEGSDNGDLVIRESGDDLLRITPDGDVTVTGATRTAGLETSQNITLTSDNAVQIGSADARLADIYLGPSSLHLIAGVDDGMIGSVDYAQQIDTQGDDKGDLVFRESGSDLVRITPDGDVSVTGSTKTAGMETSSHILPTADNSITIGEPEARIMDIFVGPGSIHMSGTSGELGGASERDWVLDLLQTGPNAGNFQIMEGSNLALSLTPTGNAAITGDASVGGKATSALTANEDAGNTLTTKSYVDNVGQSQWGIVGNAGLSDDNFIGTTDANAMVIKTDGVERMRVLATGNVGIGTANPLTPLQVDGGFRSVGPATVVGTLNFDGSLYGVGNGSVTGSFAATTGLLSGSASGIAGSLAIFDAAGNAGTIVTSALGGSRTYTMPNASGTVALVSDINANAWSKLGNAGTSPATNFVGTTDAQDLVLRSNNAERLRLTATGAVNSTGDVNVGGILSSSGAILGSSLLSVNGNINGAADGQLGTNMYRARLRLMDGVFGRTDIKSAVTGENIDIVLPATSGTLALEGSGWELGGNTGLGEGDWIGTTDAVSFTAKVNGTPRMTLNAATNNNTFDGQMSIFNTQMQVTGGIETWNGLSVHGDSWFQGDIFNVSGPTTLNGDLEVFGLTNVISGETNTLNGTLNINGTTTIGGTLNLNGQMNGDLIVADAIDVDALAGDIDATGYSISGIGAIYTLNANVTGQLNVANVGGHTMTGDLNMGGHDISNLDDVSMDDMTLDALTAGSIESTGTVTINDALRIRRSSSEPYSSFETNTAQTTNLVYTLPAIQGNPGSVLQNDGSGNLQWAGHFHREAVTIDVASIPANSAHTFTVSVSGAALGSAVSVSPGGAMIGGVFIGHVRVTAIDTVELRIINMSPATVDLPSMDWYFGIIR